MATPLKPIECSAQPLSISFHPSKDIVAAGLVDGTVEIHDLVAKGSNADGGVVAAAKPKPSGGDNDDSMESDNDDDGADTILSSIHVAKEVSPSQNNTQMLAKLDEDAASSSNANGRATCKATQAPSCRCVLFSRSPHENAQNLQSGGGEYLYTACNGGSIKCLDTQRACSLDHFQNPHDDAQSPVLWSIENAHGSGINKLCQLLHSSPCGAALVSGDDAGTVRLWDTRICGGDDCRNGRNSNPFDNLMKLPAGCIQSWKVNHDYITDFETNDDGSTLFASSADGTLSVFDVRFVNRKGTPRSVDPPDIDHHNPAVQQWQQQTNKNKKKSSWETLGYVQSDNQEDELLSLVLLKRSQKLLVGSQQGILSLFSYGTWGDISDRFPGHPQSIDALLKVDEDTVLTGSSDGLVRAVQLLPNTLLGVLGAHDGFPVEGLGWSSGRRMVGSVSHDDNIRLWDASLLNEDDNSDDGEDGEGNMMLDDDAPASGQGLGAAPTKTRGGEDSEDDWEDMDDNDDVDSDDSDDGRGGDDKPKKREKIFKSKNEEFFSDL